MNKRFILYISCLIFLITACRKNDKIDSNPNARLNFSTDSILFDTVFTDKGTTTRTLKIFNYNKNSILVNELKLFGGNNSAFNININGLPSTSIQNYEIKGNDSIYVFVKALINPNNDDSPFLVEDSLLISFNNKTQKIPLVAYGQNAIYFNDDVITHPTTFIKGKPYIIYKNLSVAEGATLNINEGARLFFHKGAKLTIKGSLKASGTFQNTIMFASDRLERIYRDEAGQWEGIHFTSTSTNNELNYCIIKNGITGIRVDSLSFNNQPKLLLSNSIIKNHDVSGIISYNGSITAINNLFFNSRQHLLALLNGGDYTFLQNTFAGYNYNFSRITPSIYIADNSTYQPDVFALKANFTNNIIWGTQRNELDIQQSGQKLFEYSFNHNLIKGDSKELGGANNLFNVDPLFRNSRLSDFRLQEISAMKGLGLNLDNHTYSSILSKDLKNSDRVYPSTLGCYEKD